MTYYVYTKDSAKGVEDNLNERLEELKKNIRVNFYRLVDWVSYHPQEAAAIGVALRFAWGKADKYLDIYRETKLRDSMIYDRSLGMYWETKRPLTANQRLIIESRHKAGESYGSILSDMKLLKR